MGNKSVLIIIHDSDDEDARKKKEVAHPQFAKHVAEPTRKNKEVAHPQFAKFLEQKKEEGTCDPDMLAYLQVLAVHGEFEPSYAHFLEADIPS